MANTRKKRSRGRYETDELEKAYQKLSPSGKKKKKYKKTHHTAGIVVITIALIAVVCSLAAGYYYFFLEDMQGIILENVSVAGVDVGGMTQADAITAVTSATQNTYGTKPMVVKVLDKEVQIPGNCVGALDVRGAVRAAYKFGNSGSTEKRQQEQKIAMTSGYQVDLTPYLSLRESSIYSYLEQLGTHFNTALSQTTYEVTGEQPNQMLTIQIGTPEYGLNLNTLYEQVLTAYSQNIFQVEGKCGIIEPESIDLEAIYQKFCKEPMDATLHPETYEVIEGIDGYGFDLEGAKKQLQSTGYGKTLKIPLKAIKPKVTANELKKMLYRDTLGSFTAKADSNTDRDINLQLACKAIDGFVIYPNDTFSYNDTLGEPTAKKGYRLGPTLSGEEVGMSYGGGISQVSSALYYCSLMAEMEILVRESNSFYPGYVPLGMDAAVDWGSIDFRFSNPSQYPVKISAEASGGTVTIKLLGTETRDYVVKLEYEELSKTDYTVSHKTYPANNADGYKNGQYVAEPYTGYEIMTYRCKQDNKTGKLISREKIDSSTYSVRNGIICKIEN